MLILRRRSCFSVSWSLSVTLGCWKSMYVLQVRWSNTDRGSYKAPLLLLVCRGLKSAYQSLGLLHSLVEVLSCRNFLAWYCAIWNFADDNFSPIASATAFLFSVDAFCLSMALVRLFLTLVSVMSSMQLWSFLSASFVCLALSLAVTHFSLSVSSCLVASSRVFSAWDLVFSKTALCFRWLVI